MTTLWTEPRGPVESGVGVPSERARVDSRWADLERLRASHPMMDAVIDEIQGRRIRIGSHWLCDFASCNYLGFDLHPEIMASVEPLVRRWGTHPSWSRLLGNPRPYLEIEERLRDCSARAGHPGAADDHFDSHLGHTGYRRSGRGARRRPRSQDDLRRGGHREGMRASLHRVRANDPGHLEEVLRSLPANMSKVFCADGVNSMTGNAPDLPLYARICREYDALLYVDDAHGFGIIGESPSVNMPWGSRGNSLVRFFGESYDNVVLVGGFSKAYSSLAAFLAVPTWLKKYSEGRSRPLSLFGAVADRFARDGACRLRCQRLRGRRHPSRPAGQEGRVLDQIESLGLLTLNKSGLPVIELPLGGADDIDGVGRFLFDRGIYVTLAAYPLVPRSQVGFRIQVTAANDDSEIEQLNRGARRAQRPVRHAAGHAGLTG